MSRLLWLSDTPTSATGMATVTRHVLKRLHATGRFTILCRGWGYQEERYDTVIFPYDIQPAAPQNQDAPAMAAAIQQFQPDFVVTLGDLWNFNWLTV